MANTRLFLTPYSAEFPASNFPQLMLVNRRPVLAYDAATKETAYWTFRAPQGIGSTLTLVLDFIAASATSGKVNWEGAIEAITDADSSPDIDAADSFDSVNDDGGTTVPATAGILKQVSITLTNKDSIAAGDLCRLSIARDAADATNDTATGDAYLLGAEIRDA